MRLSQAQILSPGRVRPANNPPMPTAHGMRATFSHLRCRALDRADGACQNLSTKQIARGEAENCRLRYVSRFPSRSRFEQDVALRSASHFPCSLARAHRKGFLRQCPKLHRRQTSQGCYSGIAFMYVSFLTPMLWSDKK